MISKPVLQGPTDVVAYFQSSVEPLFASLRDFLKAWLDDFNLHAEEEEILLDKLEEFLSICLKKRLRLSARKCKLFCKELRWCGCIISGDGHKLDPTRLSGLQTMGLPKTAEELAQLIHCCRWMSLSIPDFTRRIVPLNDMLEAAFKKAGKRTKKSICKILLQRLSWGPTHDESFHNLQESLINAAKLSYTKGKKTICVFTDASNRFWLGVVTQCEEQELKKIIRRTKA